MDIKLVLGKGSKGRGGDPGGQYWHIYSGEKRCGYVYINPGEKPSLSIELNKDSRGKGIGRVAYKMAAEQSHFNTIYLHMRKSNIASKKAAEYAGFKVIEDFEDKQLSMIWER